MLPIRSAYLGFLSVIALVICSAPVEGDVVLARTITLAGDSAPGTGEGVVFSSFASLTLNTGGQTAFLARVSGPGVTSSNRDGLWSDSSGTLVQLAREGMQAPGAADGVTVNQLISTPLLANDGHVIFEALASSGGLDFGIWGGDSNGVGKIALTGTPADIAGIDATIATIGREASSVFGGPAANAMGSTAFFATLSGGSLASSGLAVMKHVNSVMSLAAKSGNPAPGTSSSFQSFGKTLDTIIPTVNDNNQVAFYAIAGGGRGIWSEGTGVLQLVVRSGMPAPGTAVSFTDFGEPRINNAGRTAFAGVLTGSGVNSSNNTGIWSEGSGTLGLVAREGSPAAGMGVGVVYGDLVNAPLLSHDGRVAFSGPVTGGGTDANHDTAFWVETVDGIQVVAQEGMAAPGAGAGVEFAPLGVIPGYGYLPDHYGFATFNSNGILAFTAELRGTGISTDNDRSIWAFDPSGRLSLIVKTGDTIEVAPGDVRTVLEAYGAMAGGGENGNPRWFNDANELAFIARFVDGTSGVFVTAVPAGPSGDMNCDGVLDFLDVEHMALALVDPDAYAAAYPGCPTENGDFRYDEQIDGRDLAGFVAALAAE